MPDDIDVGNYQAVAVAGGQKQRIVVMAPWVRMTNEQALVHAAWLVALADESDDNAEFKRVLAAVQNT